MGKDCSGEGHIILRRNKNDNELKTLRDAVCKLVGKDVCIDGKEDPFLSLIEAIHCDCDEVTITENQDGTIDIYVVVQDGYDDNWVWEYLRAIEPFTLSGNIPFSHRYEDIYWRLNFRNGKWHDDPGTVEYWNDDPLVVKGKTEDGGCKISVQGVDITLTKEDVTELLEHGLRRNPEQSVQKSDVQEEKYAVEIRFSWNVTETAVGHKTLYMTVGKDDVLTTADIQEMLLARVRSFMLSKEAFDMIQNNRRTVNWGDVLRSLPQPDYGLDTQIVDNQTKLLDMVCIHVHQSHPPMPREVPAVFTVGIGDGDTLEYPCMADYVTRDVSFSAAYDDEIRSLNDNNMVEMGRVVVANPYTGKRTVFRVNDEFELCDNGDETIVEITLTRHRWSECALWNDTVFMRVEKEVLKEEENMSRLLKERIGAYLRTKDGLDEIFRTSFDYNWGDFVMGLSGMSEFGLYTERTLPQDAVSVFQHFGVVVDQDEWLAPTGINGRLYCDWLAKQGLPPVSCEMDFLNKSRLWELEDQKHSEDIQALIDEGSLYGAYIEVLNSYTGKTERFYINEKGFMVNEK